MTVPMFVMKRARNGLVQVSCTRCKNTFYVFGKAWLHSTYVDTRPCPYCFKVSRIRKGNGQSKKSRIKIPPQGMSLFDPTESK